MMPLAGTWNELPDATVIGAPTQEPHIHRKGVPA